MCRWMNGRVKLIPRPWTGKRGGGTVDGNTGFQRTAQERGCQWNMWIGWTLCHLPSNMGTSIEGREYYVMTSVILYNIDCYAFNCPMPLMITILHVLLNLRLHWLEFIHITHDRKLSSICSWCITIRVQHCVSSLSHSNRKNWLCEVYPCFWLLW
jgi:hypothetical protein